MSALGEFLDGVFACLRPRSFPMYWHVGFWGLALVIGIASGVAALLGAPISTTLIVFEMTVDWQTGLAVFVTVSLATALSSRYVDRSFFLTQLE